MKNIIEAIKQFNYFDTHAHVNFSLMCEQEIGIFSDCINKNILVNNIGTDEKDSLVAFNQAKKYENVFCTVGFHPETFGNYAPEQCSDLIENILKLNDGNIIAVGESGLDYTDEVDKQKQKEVFVKMINLARKYNLPLVVHVRQAHDDAIKILKEYAKDIKKVIHCFTANSTIAKKYLDLGNSIFIDKKFDINQYLDTAKTKYIFNSLENSKYYTKNNSKEKLKGVYELNLNKDIKKNSKLNLPSISLNTNNNSLSNIYKEKTKYISLNTNNNFNTLKSSNIRHKKF